MTEETPIMIERDQFLFFTQNSPYSPSPDAFFETAEKAKTPQDFWNEIQDEDVGINCFRGSLTEQEVCDVLSDEDNVVDVFRVSITGEAPFIEDITEEVAEKYIELFEIEYADPEVESDDNQPFVRDSHAYSILREEYEREKNTTEDTKPYEYFPSRKELYPVEES